MSSRREGLIRILALLQRKTLTETKHCTLKCLKWHYLTVWSGENVAVLTEDRAFALFFRPHPGGSLSSRDPTAGNLPFKPKKCLCPGISPEGGTGRRWNWLMHLTCCFLIFSLRCAKLVGSVAMQNSSWYGNDFAWKIDNLMQRATKWTFMVPGPAEQQLAALIGWGGVYLNQNNSLWTFNNIHWWFNSVDER